MSDQQNLRNAQPCSASHADTWLVTIGDNYDLFHQWFYTSIISRCWEDSWNEWGSSNGQMESRKSCPAMRNTSTSIKPSCFRKYSISQRLYMQIVVPSSSNQNIGISAEVTDACWLRKTDVIFKGSMNSDRNGTKVNKITFANETLLVRYRLKNQTWFQWTTVILTQSIFLNNEYFVCITDAMIRPMNRIS